MSHMRQYRAKKVCVSERLLRLHPHVSVEMCVLKFCVGFGMCWARGGSVSRELKVLDKTKWIWQARLIRQRFGDPFQTRRKRKNIGWLFFSLQGAYWLCLCLPQWNCQCSPILSNATKLLLFIPGWLKAALRQRKETYPFEMMMLCLLAVLSFKECELISSNIPPLGLYTQSVKPMISDTMGSSGAFLFTDIGEMHPIFLNHPKCLLLKQKPLETEKMKPIFLIILSYLLFYSWILS